jgi:hypothetical protein
VPFASTAFNGVICACVNSPLNNESVGCPNKFDNKCVQGGYKTYDMLNSVCPDRITCNMQQVFGSDSKTALIGSLVEQNCATGSKQETSEGGSTSGGGTTTSVGTETDYTIIYVGIGIAVAIIIAVVVIILLLKKK